MNAADLTLYHFQSCPYCMFVRSEVEQLGLVLAMKDTRLDKSAYAELLQGGGSRTVPCLRIKGDNPDGSDRWMYESRDIVRFLHEQFAG